LWPWPWPANAAGEKNRAAATAAKIASLRIVWFPPDVVPARNKATISPGDPPLINKKSRTGGASFAET
jgi:hypothetical protein